MTGLRRIVLDVLKTHEPKLNDLALKLCGLKEVDGVNITVYEIDKSTENIKITIEGTNLQYEPIKEIIESMNGVIHSIDEVAAGKRIIEEVKTPQDRH
ncbi:MAG: uncharacterized protein PWP15_591 [Methanothermococcus sp.]|uniref:DUF211 domain-containing protein n=1 Tax=Methanothermococcus TaxID=155862 RepID=UPI00036E5780|nr:MULTISPECIES: DUF211 domain-containing protein [Methanothermococcus]MDK2790084.1 uncharacterized protein [Methanothermococcus sp.]MDK2987992.1 uncharacterized protein [Methanothermococcus sp.]